MKTRILIACALVHLGLVLAGALGWRPDRWGNAAGDTLNWYGHLSGAKNRYSFYAPSVSTGMRATFTLTDRRGRTWTDTLGRGNTGEAHLRLDTQIAMTASGGWQTLLPQAWAASLLARHPDADEVFVRIDYRQLPPMRDWQRGEVPRWDTILSATYSHESPLSQVEHEHRDTD